MNVSICMSVCPLTPKKTAVQTSQNFQRMLSVYVAIVQSSSDDSAIHYVLPVLWMRSRLPIIGQAFVMPVGCVLNLTHQGQHRGQSLMSMIATFAYCSLPSPSQMGTSVVHSIVINHHKAQNEHNLQTRHRASTSTC